MEKAAVYIINSLQNGGAERVVLTQADALLERGIKVIIILLRDIAMYDYDDRIEIIKLTDKKEFSKIQYITQVYPLVKKINAKLNNLYEKYDIVLLSSHLLYPNVITRLTSYTKKCMYVMHCSFFIVPHAKSRIFKWFIQWLYGKQQVVCVGEGVLSEMKDYFGMHQDTLCAIVNPLDFDKIDVKLQEDFTPYEHPYLLFCGRLTSAKRPDRLLEVFYQGGFYHTHHLVLLGIGELEDELRKQVSAYGIEEQVYFAHWQENPFQWMKHADVFVLTSDYEGLAMVLLEALYSECRIVSVDCPYGPNEIMVDELKPYLCKADCKDIIEKIQLALYTYPTSLRKYTTRFHIAHHIQAYLDTYAEWNE